MNTTKCFYCDTYGFDLLYVIGTGHMHRTCYEEYCTKMNNIRRRSIPPTGGTATTSPDVKQLDAQDEDTAIFNNPENVRVHNEALTRKSNVKQLDVNETLNNIETSLSQMLKEMSNKRGDIQVQDEGSTYFVNPWLASAVLGVGIAVGLVLFWLFLKFFNGA